MSTIAEVFKETRQQILGALDEESASKLVSFVLFKLLALTFFILGHLIFKFPLILLCRIILISNELPISLT